MKREREKRDYAHFDCDEEYDVPFQLAALFLAGRV